MRLPEAKSHQTRAHGSASLFLLLQEKNKPADDVSSAARRGRVSAEQQDPQRSESWESERINVRDRKQLTCRENISVCVYSQVDSPDGRRLSGPTTFFIFHFQTTKRKQASD